MAKLTNTTIYGSANITGNVVSTGYGFDISANSGTINLSTANSITSITISNIGAGYQSVPAILIANPTTSGVTANANAIMRMGGTIVTGNVGAGYAIGDILYANVAGSVANAWFTVTGNAATTYGTGGISAITVGNYGLFYRLPDFYNSSGVLNTGAPKYLRITSNTSVSGAGANLDFSASGFVVNQVEFQNYGSGYVQQPSVTITGGSPTTTATAYAVVGDSISFKSLGYSTTNQTFMTFKGPNNVSETLRLNIGNALSPEYVTLENTQYGRSNFYAGGGTNSQLWLGATGAGYINFSTRGSSLVTQFRVADSSASAVNYLQVTGAVTGSSPILTAQGSDANVGVNITPKGAGSVNVTSALSSTSNTSGALVVTGGLGVSGNIYVGGTNAGANGIYTDVLRYAANGLPWVMGAGGAVGGNVSASGWATNALMFANSTGFLTTSSNVAYYDANNTIKTSNLILTGTTNSTSNTTGALVVSGGVGITGNVFLSAANNFFSTTTGSSYRLGWTDNYFYKDERFGGINFSGGYLNMASTFITSAALAIRGTVVNDAGNNVVVFAGSSPVLHQNTAAAVSNSTGSLIVQGGIGTSGAIYSTGGSITINNGLATTGNSGTIFLGDGSITKTYGSGWTFGGGVSISNLTVTTGIDLVSGSNTTPALKNQGTNNGLYFPAGQGVVAFSANQANALFISAPTSGVNYLQVSGNTAAASAGGPVVISSQGSDTNIGMNLLTKGTAGYFEFGSPSYLNTVSVRPGTGGVGIYASGSGSSELNIGSSGGYNLRFFTSQASNEVLRLTNTSGSVNFVQITGNTTGNAPLISAGGSDANIGINITPKGNGSVNIVSTANSTSNNTGALRITGGLGVTGNVYIGSNSRVGFANAASISVVYQIYNSANNSLDTIFG